jgi:hypothetical protein
MGNFRDWEGDSLASEFRHTQDFFHRHHSECPLFLPNGMNGMDALLLQVLF